MCIGMYEILQVSRYVSLLTHHDDSSPHGEVWTCGILLDLADGSGIIKLETALEGRSEECLSMYNVDGSMRKTCTSNLLHLFNKNPVPEKPRDYIALWTWG